jgi:hypothetical protein
MLHQVDEQSLTFPHQKVYLLQAFDHLYQHIYSDFKVAR